LLSYNEHILLLYANDLGCRKGRLRNCWWNDAGNIMEYNGKVSIDFRHICPSKSGDCFRKCKSS